MSLTDIIRGNYGFTVEVTVQEDDTAVDISSFTTLEVFLRPPDGEVKTKTAAFKTDGTDGIIQFNMADGDLDEDREWLLQVHLAATGKDICSSVIAFTVGSRLGG